MVTKAHDALRSTVARQWEASYARRLLISDTVVVVTAVFLAQYVRFGSTPLYAPVPRNWVFLHSLVLVLLWLSALATFQTRSTQVLGSGSDEYRRVISASFWIFGFIAIASLLFKLGLSRGYLAVALPVGTLALLSTRWIWRRRVLNRRSHGECMNNLIIIGNQDAVLELAGEVMRHKDNAYRIVGLGIYGQVQQAEYLEVEGQRIPILGDDEQALESAESFGADSVALAGPERLGGNGLRYLLWDLERRHIKLIVSPTASPLVIQPVPGYPLLQVQSPQFLQSKRFTKRAFDVVFAAVALLLASPLLLLAAAAIKLTTRGPVIYREERVGLGGATFQMVKLRTIADGNDALFDRLSDPVGRLLRRFNVDEIPNLLNVLNGDMSVVGPRPQLAQNADDYATDPSRRPLVRPGITGMNIKRALDVFLVIAAMPLWFPLLITIGLFKYAVDGSPLLYLSSRIGRRGRPFTVYKFRTMVDDPEFIQEQISRLGRSGFEAIPLDNPVYTRIGRIYERFQFVELPQLLNVLKGDMSLVGYRPLPQSHVADLERDFGQVHLAQRHTYAPGITGFAQLSDKSMLDNESRIKIEVAEAEFFASATWLDTTRAYFGILISTFSYLILGSNQHAIRLRDKWLFGPSARSLDLTSPEQLNGPSTASLAIAAPNDALAQIPLDGARIPATDGST